MKTLLQGQACGRACEKREVFWETGSDIKCPEGPGTLLLRNWGLKTMIIMAFGPKSLIIGYLDPLGWQLSFSPVSRRWSAKSGRTQLIPSKTRTQRVQLDCHYGIRAQKPYMVWLLDSNSILAV